MSELLYEGDGEIRVITFNRPERRNAISLSVRKLLHDAFLQFESDKEARVAILTGSGKQAFCAGMDLKEAAEIGMTIVPPMPTLGENMIVTKPVIAAVNGVAYAGGWLMAQMCDLCIAAESAQFGITEAKVGRGFPWAVPLFAMIPERLVLELLMTGRSISARRAYEMGFVNEVVDDDSLMRRALEMAREIAANAPLPIAAAKEMRALAAEMGRAGALKFARQLFDDKVYRSADAIEGPRAFREKRKPVWQGR